MSTSVQPQPAPETAISDSYSYATACIERLFGHRLALSVKECCQVLPISETQVYSLIKEEQFPAMKMGRRTLVPVAGLLDWVERGGSHRSETERMATLIDRARSLKTSKGASSSTWRTDAA